MSAMDRHAAACEFVQANPGVTFLELRDGLGLTDNAEVMDMVIALERAGVATKENESAGDGRWRIWPKVRIRITGRTYAAAIEDSGVPAQEGWPQPQAYHRRGKRPGVSYVYWVTWQQRDQIVSHLRSLIGAWSPPADAEVGRDVSAIKADLRRMGEEVW